MCKHFFLYYLNLFDRYHAKSNRAGMIMYCAISSTFCSIGVVKYTFQSPPIHAIRQCRRRQRRYSSSFCFCFSARCFALLQSAQIFPTCPANSALQTLHLIPWPPFLFCFAAPQSQPPLLTSRTTSTSISAAKSLILEANSLLIASTRAGVYF